MANLTHILIGAGIAGGAILLVRRIRAQQTPTPPAPSPEQDKCAAAAAAAERLQPGAGAMAYAACKGLGGLLDSIAGANNKDEKHANETARRDAINKQLNGAVKLAAPGTPGGADVSVRPGVTGSGELAEGYWYDEDGKYIRRYGSHVRGSVVEFENGCQPFRDAPGWSKCAPGTLSMWAEDIDEAMGYLSEYDAGGSLKTSPAFPSLEAYEAQARQDGSNQVIRSTVPAALLSGSARLEGADPLTQGPFRAKDGRLWWLYKGRRIDCPVGQAPDVIQMAAAGVVDHRTNQAAPRCVPLGADSPWTSSSSAPPPGAPPSLGEDKAAQAAAGHGTGYHEDLRCNGTQAPPGWTWVPSNRTSAGGTWQRLKPGETPNHGPCDPNYRPPWQRLTGVQSSTLLQAATLAVRLA